MFKSPGCYPMATKASGILLLIIEKQHASWDLMITGLPTLDVHFWCQLRKASARPILGPSGPCARVVVHVYEELSYGLPLACIPFSGLLRLFLPFAIYVRWSVGRGLRYKVLASGASLSSAASVSLAVEAELGLR